MQQATALHGLAAVVSEHQGGKLLAAESDTGAKDWAKAFGLAGADDDERGKCDGDS